MYTPEDFQSGRYLLIDKPIHWTSHDVVAKIRGPLKSFCSDKNLKIGHAGTLDPLATGLLIMLTGKFTKQSEPLQNLDKEYTGTITLGATTASFDAETEITEYFDIAHITPEKIQSTAQQFTGAIEQLPPQFSSVKVGGVRAYKMARMGETLELKWRSVHIFQFEITGINMPEVHFRVHCSKGTYIRSLANDFGKALGAGAYLSALRRTKVGDFTVENASSLVDFLKSIGARNIPEIV